MKLSSLALIAAMAISGAAAAQPQDRGRSAESPVRFAQVFTFKIGEERVLSGARGFVWGAKGPIAGSCASLYAPAYRLYLDKPARDLEWLFDTHPDWIVYHNDRSTIAWEFNNTKYPPFDFTNPQAEAFEIATLMAHAVGMCAVGFDNVGAYNAFLNAGHYAAARAPCPPAQRPTCGGSWHQDFGGVSTKDPLWVAANEKYIRNVHRALKAAGVSLVINNSWSSASIDAADQAHLAALADGELKEGFPYHGCTTQNGYLHGRIVDALFSRALTQNRLTTKHLWIADATLCEKTVAGASQDELAWTIANYLLVMQKPSGNMLSITNGNADAPDHGAIVQYPSGTSPRIGMPVEEPPVPGCMPCSRRFRHGFLVVNPSSTVKADFIAPPDSQTDQFGNPVSPGLHQLAPATAIVIQTAVR